MSGFQTPEVFKKHPYHIISFTGGPHTGKTRFAATAPPGVRFQSLDLSTESVIDPFLEEGKDIKVAEYPIEVDLAADDLFKEGMDARDDGKKEQAKKLADKQANRVYNEVWVPFVRDFKSAIADEVVRTIVWDTADAVNEVLRLAYHGKLEKNPEIAYGPINAEYKNLVKMANFARKNLVMLHQMGDVYVVNARGQSEKTGKQKRKGNSSADYLVHSFVESTYAAPTKPDPAGEDFGTFTVTIRKARMRPQATGKVLLNPDWVTLMMELMPDVDPEVWG